ncbi:LytR/AlgR family response regulator transcription factor [Dyadobacter fanqingshengii]|uniref:LytTR family DNA-binding domain-containing protein n=1 Tax=Dyadobacter fanqingshengii TaxID=2906443 RepID=A0A9X1PAP4_9BACT|nr:LytTR family DNA-binding domain-containing protein [Dyadobacter fanqingshengii]MCF0039822.1 LytTR family DNA-binding domain-containing protein [Dyadobacter fanqingshengii]USJ38415.1 LytTR family DNA-binding domain-containing protein [Dyadobacter fanqingshengii]
MNVLIVEDEELSAERLQKLILGIDPSIQVLAIIPSVLETIAYLENDAKIKPDLIFLDIHLEDDNGFRIIESLNLLIPVIFTTAFDEYLLKAFRANSIDYLLKPINPLELQAALVKFRKLSAISQHSQTVVPVDVAANEPYKDRFLCTAGPRIFTFKTSEIAYFTIEERATFLRLYDGRHFAVEYSLEKLSQILDPGHFFRINRTLLISIDAIRDIHTISAGRLKIELNPAPSQEVNVSPDRITGFKNWLGR